MSLSLRSASTTSPKAKDRPRATSPPRRRHLRARHCGSRAGPRTRDRRPSRRRPTRSDLRIDAFADEMAIGIDAVAHGSGKRELRRQPIARHEGVRLRWPAPAARPAGDGFPASRRCSRRRGNRGSAAAAELCARSHPLALDGARPVPARTSHRPAPRRSGRRDRCTGGAVRRYRVEARGDTRPRPCGGSGRTNVLCQDWACARARDAGSERSA